MNKTIGDVKGARAELRARISIVRVVTDDLGPAPKQTGQDHMWCCPFHGEKTPSFGVHDTMGIYKCFGCHVGGDAISWTQAFHNLSQAEAVQVLAFKYGIDISPFERELSREEKEIELMLSIQDYLANECSKSLFHNKQMLDWYINDTKFSYDQVADYSVGYSTSPDDNIKLIYQKFPDVGQAELDKLELTRKLMWTNSLVYPIKDASGRVVRFHNKPLSPPSDMAGKYIGYSHSHPLFTHKVLYGFDFVRKNLRSNATLRIVEGQKAAIASGGVAMLGSSLHEEQAKLVKEHNIKEVVVCFDGDSAGRAASLKFLDDVPMFDDIPVLIARMPDDKQPDDLSPGDLEEVFKQAKMPVEYYINDRYGDSQLQESDKFRIIKDLKNYLSKLSDLHMQMTANYLSGLLGVDSDTIRSFVSEAKVVGNSLINRDIEVTVLRGLLINPEYWSTIKQAVENSRAFTSLPHQKIYEAVESLAIKARDTGGPASVTPQSVRDDIAIRYPQYKDMPAYVSVLLEQEPKYEFFDALSKLVDLARRRTALEQTRLFSALVQDLTKQTADVVSKYRRQLVSTIDVRKDQASTPGQLAAAVAKELEIRSARKNAVIGFDFSVVRDVDNANIPCLTGLTYALQGLQKQHQVIISANSGVGKSLIGLQMATSISVCPDPSDRVPTLWIPLEMNSTEITMRMVSQLSGVDNNKVQAGNLNRDEHLRVDKALHMIAEGKLYMQKPRFGSAEEIFSIIDEYKFKYGIEAVFLDYIQMIASGDSDRGASREEVIGKCSKMMKLQVAESMGVVSVCIAQQNRQNFRAGETTKIESVGGSYQVAQDADDFLTMSEKTPDQMSEEKGQRGNRKGFLDKRRGGASDVILDLDLDTIGCSLRFRETMSPGTLYGLSAGVGSTHEN